MHRVGWCHITSKTAGDRAVVVVEVRRGGCSTNRAGVIITESSGSFHNEERYISALYPSISSLIEGCVQSTPSLLPRGCPRPDPTQPRLAPDAQPHAAVGAVPSSCALWLLCQANALEVEPLALALRVVVTLASSSLGIGMSASAGRA